MRSKILVYGSLLNYSPRNRGTSEPSRRSRVIADKLKSAEKNLIKQVCIRLKEKKCEVLASTIFPPETILVPIPGHAKLLIGGLWVSNEIAKALLNDGIGSSIAALIERKSATRSSRQSGFNRPSVKEHYDSIGIKTQILQSNNITLVDDVVTKGATAYACYLRLKEAYPLSNVRLFAVMRTCGLVQDIVDLVEPTVGSILYIDSEAIREP